MSTYFRKAFEFDADAFEGLYDKAILSVRVDDGAAVYLNGVELTRFNMLALPVTYNIIADQQTSYDAETASRTFEFDPSLLKDGTNLLAVSVHLRYASSDDLGFDLRLALTKQAFFDPQVVLTDPNAEEVLIADINQDGLGDVIYTVDPSPYYPNPDPTDPGASEAPATIDQVRCALALPGGGYGTPIVIDADFHGVDRILVGDLDLDGDPDLAATDRDDPVTMGGIRIYHNENGTFSLAQHLTGLLPIDMTIADFNGDGYLDIAHQNITSFNGGTGNIVWRANDQTGSFGAVQSLTSERSVWQIDSGDMDGDGDLDIVATEGVQDRVVWWKNNGTGGFPTRHVAYSPSLRPRYFTLADIDGDNAIDYLSNYTYTAWARNNGNGRFRDRQGILQNVDSRQMRVADFDQDGDLDLAYVVEDQDIDLEWNENDGRANFTGPRPLAFGSQSELAIKGLAVGNVDDDGKPDLIAIEEVTGKFLFYRNKLNAGPAVPSFTVNRNTVSPGESVTLEWDASGASEVRLDGEVVASVGTRLVTLTDHDTVFRLTASNGIGTTLRAVTVFVPSPIFDAENPVSQGPYDGMSRVATGDMNGDGTNDVVFASTNTGEIGWLSNNGNQEFSAPIYLAQNLTGVVCPIAEDFDKDGDVDVAALSTGTPLVYFENMGDGVFSPPQTLSGSLQGTFMKATDADQDGWLDLVIADDGGTGKILINNWNGGWTGPTNLPFGDFTDCRITDVTGDGIADFLYLDSSDIKVYPGSGGLQFPLLDGYTITPPGPHDFQTFEVADLDGDGRLDVVYLEGDSAGFLKGRADGEFEIIPEVFKNLPTHLVDSALADFDGDGDLDLAILTLDPSGADRIFWMESDGRGAFSEPQLISDTIAESFSIEVTDLDQDGDFDLLTPGRADTITWIRNATGSLGAPRLSPESDSGTQDNRTNLQRLDFTGLAAPGTVITLESAITGTESALNEVIGTAIADGFGSWTISATKLSEGDHHLIVKTGTGATSSLDVTIDTSTMPPEQLRLSSDPEASPDSVNGTTWDLTPTITGMAEAGSTVVLTSSLDGVVGSGVANAEFWITTSPLSVGVHQITAIATDLAGNVSEASAPLTLSVQSPPEIELEQPAGSSLVDGSASVAYGSKSIGSSTQRTFTIRNTGGADLTDLVVTLDGAHPNDFIAGPIGLTTLAPGASTTFILDFSPLANGNRSASLHLASNDEDENPFDVSLSGTGLSPEIIVEQPVGNELTDNAATIDFGSQNLAGGSVNQTFTVRNTGNQNLTGLAITIDGNHPNDFSASNPGTTTLTPNQSTTFTVTFDPTGGGNRTAELHLASNDLDENPFDIILTGSGIQPEIAVEGSSGNQLSDGFSTVVFDDLVGTSSPSSDLSLTIRNTGVTPLTGLSTTIGGLDATDFSADELSSSSLAPGESMTLTLHFSTTINGDRTADLQIFSNDANENPFDIGLKASKLDSTTLQSWAGSFGLSGSSATPMANDDGDPFTLLEEYAYNLNPTLADGDPLETGISTSGTPLFRLVGTGNAAHLEVEFLRRRSDPNLTYTVEFGSTLSTTPSNDFAPATEPESSTPIDLNWKRVTVRDSATVASQPRRFGRIKLEYSGTTP
ncbi:MAG: VCBS repeat-containing protein [Verrucomicrobiae bacterium]|nr:VCBS repeat-containing protein [Verrucomicrobiae bacterium]